MKNRRARVFIIDESALARCSLSVMVEDDPLLELVGTSPNGTLALPRISDLVPDLILLDLERPARQGLEVLARLRRQHPKTPVVVLGGASGPDAETVIRALSLGAADFACKPQASQGTPAEGEATGRPPLFKTIRSLLASSVVASDPATDRRDSRTAGRSGEDSRALPPEVVAVGVSTGGPSALMRLLGDLSVSFPIPLLIAQHMPPLFTKILARRLSEETGLEVREAEEGDVLRSGLVLVAPGDFHMILRKRSSGLAVSLHQGERRNFCRPSVDVLFESVAEVCGSRTVAVVLTGMGQDGVGGARRLKARGASIIVQDRDSSVVWGMPGAVMREQLADVVLPIHEIGAELHRHAEGLLLRTSGDGDGRR